MTDECAQAFNELKYKLTNAPIWILSDADTGTGAVLLQVIDGHEKFIAYVSHTPGEKILCYQKGTFGHDEFLSVVLFVQRNTATFEMVESLRSGQLNSESQDLTNDTLGSIIRCKEAGENSEKPAEEV